MSGVYKKASHRRRNRQDKGRRWQLKVWAIAGGLAVASFVALAVATPAFATPANTTYTYDAAGRVISASYINGSTVVIMTYSYDAAGNRTYTVVSTAGVWGAFLWGSAKW
jgi:hypothetical protein